MAKVITPPAWIGYDDMTLSEARQLQAQRQNEVLRDSIRHVVCIDDGDAWLGSLVFPTKAARPGPGDCYSYGQQISTSAIAVPGRLCRTIAEAWVRSGRLHPDDPAC